MSGSGELLEFETREEASAFAAEHLGKALDAGLAARSAASLLASGGSTPAETYGRLAGQPRDWTRVTVGLVDERWVEPGDPRSNEGLLRRTLVTGPAAEARLHPMKSESATPEDAATAVDARYREIFSEPPDAALLGMGGDGHTASWFPGARGLDEALDPDSSRHVVAIDAQGAPVAGDCPARMTLTLAAVRRARAILLLLFGGDKRDVLERAMRGPDPELPVSALLPFGRETLTIAWAP